MSFEYDAEVGIHADEDENLVIEGSYFQVKCPMKDVDFTTEFFKAAFKHEFGPYLSSSFPNSREHLSVIIYAYEMDEVTEYNMTQLILDDIPENETDPYILDGYIEATENMLAALKARRDKIPTDADDA